MALVREMKSSSSTLLTRAGNPCRQILNEYQRVDYLDSFYKEVLAASDSSDLKAIPVAAITGKAIQIQLCNSDYKYVIKQPNHYERH